MGGKIFNFFCNDVSIILIIVFPTEPNVITDQILGENCSDGESEKKKRS